MYDPISEAVDQLIAPVKAYTGFSSDITKSFVSFTFTFIFAFIWPHLKAGAQRHFSSLVSGVFMLLFSYGTYSTLAFLGLVIPSYIIIACGFGQRHPLVVFAFNMVYLLTTFGYYYKTAYGVWQMDITGPLMIAVQKCTSLAWNLFDGHRQSESIKKNGGVPPEKPVLRTSHQRRVAINECPSFFKFISWIFFPISISYGPSAEYSMYISSVERTTSPLKSRYKLFFEQLILGIICMVYFVKPTDTSFIYDEKFIQKPLIKKILIIHISMEWTRLKYYAAWSLTNAAMILAGAGFDGHSWEGAINCFIFRLETARRPRVFIADWNCGTQRFLKYYIYVRGPTDKKTGQLHPFMQYTTFIVSAVWHGWYLAYSLHFSILFLINVIDRLYFSMFPIKNEKRPLLYGIKETEKELKELEAKKKEKDADAATPSPLLPSSSPSPMYSPSMTSAPSLATPAQTSTATEAKNEKTGLFDVLRGIFDWMWTGLLFNYAASTFAVLIWPDVLQINRVVDWWGLKVIAVVIPVLMVMKTIKGKKQRKEKNSKEL